MAKSDLLSKLAERKAKIAAEQKEKEVDPVIVISAGLVTALVVIVLLSVFVIYPSVNSIISMYEQINQNQDLLNRLTKKQSDLADGKRKYDAQPETFDRLNYCVPNESAYIEDFKILERIAAETVADGVNFILLQMSLGTLPIYQEPTKDARAYEQQTQSFNLIFRADYLGAQVFLNNIKASLRNYTIKSVAFSPGGNRNSGLLDISCQLENAYYSAY